MMRIKNMIAGFLSIILPRKRQAKNAIKKGRMQKEWERACRGINDDADKVGEDWTSVGNDLRSSMRAHDDLR